MATYKGINGFAVQSVASDPSPLDEGQVWYNNATYAFKLAAVTTAGTWAAGGNMNTGSYNPAALVGGLQTAALAGGGDTGAPAYSSTKTESYNGTSWTTVNSLNTARSAGTGTGTQTAAIIFGAFPPANAPATESWGGSSWTTLPATLAAPVERSGAAGTQTAALAFSYYNRPADTAPTTMYSWNGSAWTTSPASMNTSRYGGSGLGTQTSALAIGGIRVSPPAQLAATESYNGTSWTTVNSLNTARGYAGASGTQSLAAFFGGNPGSPTAATELWNGTSWTNSTSMSTARGGLGSSGTQAAGLAYGGGSYLTSTEEFTGPGAPVTKTITTS